MEKKPEYDKIKNIITENIFLHFFNREIYRGILGDKGIDHQNIDHTDIITTLLLCGCNTLYSSFTSYRETVSMLTGKGEIYRKLYKLGLVSVCGETLNVDLNLAKKQEIYYFDKERYPGYFGREAQELDFIYPSIQKPDLTDMLDSRFRGDRWQENVLGFTLHEKDRQLLRSFQSPIQKIINEREEKAITSSLFAGISGPIKLQTVLGQTTSGMYVDNYLSFLDADIITGICPILEYDYLAKGFPFHDYSILRLLLRYVGFHERFFTEHLDRVLEYYDTYEHDQFAYKIISVLDKLLDNNKSVISPILLRQQQRINIESEIRRTLDKNYNSINMKSNSFFEQALDSISEIQKKLYQKRGKKMMPMDNVNKDVFVVYGRDKKLRQSVFSLLRALNLHPLDWEAVVSKTGSGSPNTFEAIMTSLNNAAAFIVILAPEEETQLIKTLHSEIDDDKVRKQPRANVIFEAGIVLGTNREKTILLQFGQLSLFSDIQGVLTVKYSKDKDQDFKTDLYHRLKTILGNYLDFNTDYQNTTIEFSE